MRYFRRSQWIWYMINGYRIPRKIKKSIIGIKFNKSKRLKEFKKGNFDFCPKCGCQHFHYINHNVEYPEVWTETKCINCGNKVGGADNSYDELFIETLSIKEFEEVEFELKLPSRYRYQPSKPINILDLT